MRFRLAFILIALLFAHPGNALEERSPEVFFYVIAVPPPPGFGELLFLYDRAYALEQFIKSTYKVDEAHLKVRTTVDETSSTSIRQILYKEIPSLPHDSLIFFFLLTHAKLYQPIDSSPDSADLQIIASDTKAGELTPSTAIHGAEIIDSFSRAPIRSLVFGFIDSCDSGAIGSFNSELIGFLGNRIQSPKMFIATSSSIGELSYDGSFTQALIDVWSEQGSIQCLGRDYFKNALDAKLKARHQHTQVIAEFAGACLNFANDRFGLLVVSNSGKRMLSVEFTSDDGVSLDNKVISQKEEVSLIPIPRRKLHVSISDVAYRSSLGGYDIDFTDRPVSLINTVTEKSAEETSAKYLAISDLVNNLGFGSEAQVYKMLAAGWARQGGEIEQAQKIAMSINKDVAPKEVISALDYIDAGENSYNVPASVLSTYLSGFREFAVASPVYQRALIENTTDPELFGGAYTSFVLSGKSKAARELREENPVAFSWSEEAQATKLLLQKYDDLDPVAELALTSAAVRTGLVFDLGTEVAEEAGAVMEKPPPKFK